MKTVSSKRKTDVHNRLYFTIKIRSLGCYGYADTKECCYDGTFRTYTLSSFNFLSFTAQDKRVETLYSRMSTGTIFAPDKDQCFNLGLAFYFAKSNF